MLLASAKTGGIGGHSLRPIYCFYCADKELDIWSVKRTKLLSGSDRLGEYGCLIADAKKIKEITKVRKLADVEKHSVPWHYLFQNRPYRIAVGEKEPLLPDAQELLIRISDRQSYSMLRDEPDKAIEGSEFPTITQLNGMDDTFSGDQIGVWETTSEDYASRRDIVLKTEPNISRFMSIDVSERGEAHD